MALTAKPADQALLLDLQAFDTKISQLEHRAKKLPEHEELASIQLHRDKLQLSLLEERGLKEDIELELSRIDSDVKVVEARIAAIVHGSIPVRRRRTWQRSSKNSVLSAPD